MSIENIESTFSAKYKIHFLMQQNRISLGLFGQDNLEPHENLWYLGNNLENYNEELVQISSSNVPKC